MAYCNDLAINIGLVLTSKLLSAAIIVCTAAQAWPTYCIVLANDEIWLWRQWQLQYNGFYGKRDIEA